MEDLSIVPKCVHATDEFLSLSDAERWAFASRIRYLRQIGDELRTGDRLRGSNNLADFLDDLELDLAIRLRLPTDERGGLSIWLIHHSWTFGTTAEEMRSRLPLEMTLFVDASEPSIESGSGDVGKWYVSAGEILVRAADGFSSALVLSEALAFHIIIDLTVAKLLTACYKLRLNKKVQA